MEIHIWNLVIITKEELFVESFITKEQARERLNFLLGLEDLIIGGPGDECDVTDYGDDHYLLNQESYERCDTIEWNIVESIIKT